MYTVHHFGRMLVDRVRVEAFQRALDQRLKPGDVVIDIGTGTGFWAMLCLQKGASKVYAVDPNPAVIAAKKMAEANGMSDRIVFFRERSDRIEIPEKVDLMVSDLRGVTPLIQGHLKAVQDARERFLKPGGHQIGQKDTLFCKLVQNPQFHKKVTAVWTDNRFGLDLSAGLPYAVNSQKTYGPEHEEAATVTARLGEIDYRTHTDSRFDEQAQWKLEEDLTVHGISMWFEAELADGITISTSPYLPRKERAWIYGTMVWPLGEALELKAGAEVQARFIAHETERGYQYTWEVASGEQRRRHSTFLGQLLTPEMAAQRNGGNRAELNRRGLVQRKVLNGLAQGNSFEEVANSLIKEFPQWFEDQTETLQRVVRMARVWVSAPD